MSPATRLWRRGRGGCSNAFCAGRLERASRRRRRAALEVVVILALAASTFIADPVHATPPPSEPPAAAVGDLVVDLAAAGIEVFADAADSAPFVAARAPVSPLRLLRDQVVSLGGELHGGGGVPVEVLDAEMEPLNGDDGADFAAAELVAPSQLIVAWATGGSSAASTTAAEMLSSANAGGEITVVPQLVLVLFLADAATVGASLPEAGTTPAGWVQVGRAQVGGAPAAEATTRSAAALPAGPCSDAIGFIDHVLATVFNAIGRLRTPPPVHTGFGLFDSFVNGLVGIAVGGVNLVIEGAEFVIAGITKLAIGTVMSYVGRVAAVAGSAAAIASAVRPWALRLDAQPPTVEAPNGGLVHGRIDLGGFDTWPNWAVNCAHVAGVTLPPLRPSGNPVTWHDSSAGLLAPGELDRTLRDDGTAQYHYTVTADPPRVGVPTVTTSVRVDATVRRDDTRQLEEEVERMIATELDRLTSLAPGVGGLISPLVLPLIRPWIGKAFDFVKHLRDVHATARIEVHYADPNPPEAPDPIGTLNVDCPSGDAVSAGTGIPFPDPDRWEPENSLGWECLYGYDPYLAIIIAPSIAWPTADELAASYLQEDSECNPASIGEPLTVEGATRAMVGCRSFQNDSVMILVMIDDVVVAVFAGNDQLAVAAAEVVLGTR